MVAADRMVQAHLAGDEFRLAQYCPMAEWPPQAIMVGHCKLHAPQACTSSQTITAVQNGSTSSAYQISDRSWLVFAEYNEIVIE